MIETLSILSCTTSANVKNLKHLQFAQMGCYPGGQIKSTISANFENGVSLSLKCVVKIKADCKILQRGECIHIIQQAGEVNLTISFSI